MLVASSESSAIATAAPTLAAAGEPRWLRAVAFASATLVAALGAAGLLLADIGIYRLWAAQCELDPSLVVATAQGRPSREVVHVCAPQLDAPEGDDALARCHGQGNCTEVCPQGLAPTTSIIRLRQMATRRLLRLG